ncbi:hypothetical protein SteCoe_31215 [Stentor coeruleus]|uniref:Transmembrane protein 230 n=1 Tax=Stentor coeruleus TaxID=5963 RepID=A0A1R2B1T6_9CILI|nr:hypothetical protein SteCoe_31215 [Stentor coeruleus]
MESSPNEPEILVPPDMVNLEIESETKNEESGYPVLKLIYALISSFAILIFVCIGLFIYITTQDFSLSWPFWVAAIVIFPWALYFFYSLADYLSLHDEHKKLVEEDQ